MSDVNTSTAPAADAAAPAADTSITGDGGAAPLEGGQQSDPPGGGDPAKAEGQGTGGEKDASADGKKPVEGEGADAPGAPEAYEAFTLPDGFELPDEMSGELTTFAKAHKLNQSQAQALVDLGVKQAQAIIQDFTAKAMENPVLLSEHHAQEWSKQTAADAELGGEKLGATMALATRVFATFASPALGEFLSKTGLAHHPEMVRFMAKVGAAVSEDTLVTPQGGTKRVAQGGDRDQRAASKLYPSMK